MLTRSEGGQPASPWAMQMKAVSAEEPSRLVQSLTGAILGCGGWVLSRGANDTGMMNMLFEFERQACVDIYSVLIAAGSGTQPERPHPIHGTVPVHAQPAARLRQRRSPASISRFKPILQRWSAPRRCPGLM